MSGGERTCGRGCMIPRSSTSPSQAVYEEKASTRSSRYLSSSSLPSPSKPTFQQVPVDTSASNKSLGLVYKSIRSDNVRLLWLKASSKDWLVEPGMPSTSLFYTPPPPNHLRSKGGPVRKEIFKRLEIVLQ